MLDPHELEMRLSTFARMELFKSPTPITRLDRLTKSLGGPTLWIKREDGSDIGLSGNKVRNLEYIFAEIIRQKKSGVVTFGGSQSNHARLTAGFSAALGLEANLFFFANRPAKLEGNLLLDRLFGANVHFVPYFGSGSGVFSIETTSFLVRLLTFPWILRGAYFMPVGGFNVTGCLGYVRAALELHYQCEELFADTTSVTIVTACGTGGTLSGLLAGIRLLDSPLKVIGIDVGNLWRSFAASIARMAERLCATLGDKSRFYAADIPIIEKEYVGSAYGVFSSKAREAIALLAASEAIILDPIYTGKAFAGLLDMIEKRNFTKQDHVIFLHTGGAPGIWAYSQDYSPLTIESILD